MDKSKNHIYKNTYIKNLLTLEEYTDHYPFPEIPANFLEHDNYLKSQNNYCRYINYAESAKEYFKNNKYSYNLNETNNPVTIEGTNITINNTTYEVVTQVESTFEEKSL